MNVFITGATGFIGSAIARRLLAEGHRVTALVRPQTDAAWLENAGAVIVRGELAGIGDAVPVIAQHEVRIHTAVSPKDTSAVDRAAIDALLTPAANGALLYTSGVWVLGNTGSADEDTPVNPLPISRWRAPHEQLALEAVRPDFSVAVIRPGCLYGGSQSLLAPWFAAVDENLPIRISGDGTNRWSMIHIDDLVDFYLRAIDRRASGILHATDDSDSTLKEMADAVGAGKVPVEHRESDGGPLAGALMADQHVFSEKTRKRLGWEPQVRTFLSSIDRQWAEWRASR
jgi:nucleoside-diphosphate-sugar epimerase